MHTNKEMTLSMITVDTPDPYIKLCIRTAPEGRKQTTVKDNEVNPVWNESFTFLLDEAVENIMGKQSGIKYFFLFPLTTTVT